MAACSRSLNKPSAAQTSANEKFTALAGRKGRSIFHMLRFFILLSAGAEKVA